MIWTLKELQSPNNPQTCIDGKWVPARPENWKYRRMNERIREALSVFKGKAEAFTWPKGQ